REIGEVAKHQAPYAKARVGARYRHGVTGQRRNEVRRAYLVERHLAREHGVWDGPDRRDAKGERDHPQEGHQLRLMKERRDWNGAEETGTREDHSESAIHPEEARKQLLRNLRALYNRGRRSKV